MYTTSGIQRLYNVSPQTVRNWTNKFSKHLSPSANPPDGKRRQFTVEDLTVFSLVKELTDKGFNYDEVHVSLDRGDRGEVPEEATSSGLADEFQDLSAGEIARSLSLIKQRDHAFGRIEQLEIEGEKKDEEITKLNEKINELNREFGKFEAKLEMEQKNNPKE